jgi:hypothetical protein
LENLEESDCSSAEVTIAFFFKVIAIISAYCKNGDTKC